MSVYERLGDPEEDELGVRVTDRPAVGIEEQAEDGAVEEPADDGADGDGHHADHDPVTELGQVLDDVCQRNDIVGRTRAKLGGERVALDV